MYKLTDAQEDDFAVDRIAVAMKHKLAVGRAKGKAGWADKDDCGVEYLNRMLLACIDKHDPLDVAIIAMMLWSRGDTTAHASDIIANINKRCDSLERAVKDTNTVATAYTQRCIDLEAKLNNLSVAQLLTMVQNKLSTSKGTV